MYDYGISFKHSKEHGNADGLSRLPLPSSQPTVGKEGVTIFNEDQIQALPLTFQDIKSAMKCDGTLSRVLDYVKTGWPKEVPNDVMDCQYSWFPIMAHNLFQVSLFTSLSLLLPSSQME